VIDFWYLWWGVIDFGICGGVKLLVLFIGVGGIG